MSDLVIILVILISALLLYLYLKPYFIKHDTTILFCGGLGSGKSLNSVKQALFLLKKQRNKIYFKNLKIKLYNLLHKNNKKAIIERPILYSNIPIRVNRREMSTPLTREILTLKTRIREYSVVFIDELPLICNQFNWNLNEVKYNMCEFVALFRHYVGGYLIVNGQSESEIVKQIRAKLNSYFWCFNFQKFLCFYRVRIMHSQITENSVSLSSEFIEDNTKWTYGILTKRYDTRAFSERYKNIEKINDDTPFTKNLKINNIVRFDSFKSPCDDK